MNDNSDCRRKVKPGFIDKHQISNKHNRIFSPDEWNPDSVLRTESPINTTGYFHPKRGNNGYYKCNKIIKIFLAYSGETCHPFRFKTATLLALNILN
jgi:hypothetical protein